MSGSTSQEDDDPLLDSEMTERESEKQKQQSLDMDVLSLGHPRDDSTASSWNPFRKFPIAMAFMVGNEFCERFSYYGMRAVLGMLLFVCRF